jgi:hypothetical protein
MKAAVQFCIQVLLNAEKQVAFVVTGALSTGGPILPPSVAEALNRQLVEVSGVSAGLDAQSALEPGQVTDGTQLYGVRPGTRAYTVTWRAPTDEETVARLWRAGFLWLEPKETSRAPSKLYDLIVHGRSADEACAKVRRMLEDCAVKYSDLEASLPNLARPGEVREGLESATTKDEDPHNAVYVEYFLRDVPLKSRCIKISRSL